MLNETSSCHKCGKTDVDFSSAPHGRRDRLLFLLVSTDVHVIKVGPMSFARRRRRDSRQALCLNFVRIVRLYFTEFREMAVPVSAINDKGGTIILYPCCSPLDFGTKNT